MARPSRRTARLLSVGAGVACLAASAAVVWQASYSAFSAQTSNPTNNWAAGTVLLSDDDSNTAMFSASNLKPGNTGSKCIAVTSTGTLPSAVKLYGTAAATTNALSTWINLVITQGTGGSFGSCTGFTPLASGSSVYSGTLASFATASTSYSNGVGSWAPTGSGSDTRVFQISYTFDPTAPNSTQAGTASVGFTWEAQNT
ncbi:MAG: TasA family protein [Jatrophihabitantaceae bacterium]